MTIRATTAQNAAAKTNCRSLDDADLVRVALKNDQAAWRELVRRFEPVVRLQIGRTIQTHAAGVMGSDAVDEILGDFYLALVGKRMEFLRSWDPTRGTQLASWLGLLATRTAISRVRKEYRHAAIDSLDEVDVDADPSRGGRWIAVEKNAR